MNSGSKDGSSDNIFFHQLMKNHSPRGPPYKRLKNRRGIIINRTCHVTPLKCLYNDDVRNDKNQS